MKMCRSNILSISTLILIVDIISLAGSSIFSMEDNNTAQTWKSADATTTTERTDSTTTENSDTESTMVWIQQESSKQRANIPTTENTFTTTQAMSETVTSELITSDTTTSEPTTTTSITTTTTTPCEVKVTERTTRRILKRKDVFQICRAYKPANQKLKQHLMVDVWHTFFYKNMEKVPCIKIYIIKITDAEKEDNARTFGDFNGEIDWRMIDYEIKANQSMKRKHFLQGDGRLGILHNVIIVEESLEDDLFKTETTTAGKLSFILKPEVPNQWLVHQNFLLMRDCETGGVLVFTKVLDPSKYVLDQGLKVFGEMPVGNYTCLDWDSLQSMDLDK